MSYQLKIEGRCPHCHTGIGQFHREPCSMEICPICGQFAESCPHSKEVIAKAGRLTWCGYCPGVREAVTLGMFLTINDIEIPDTNRFFSSHRWDPEKREYTKINHN